MPAGRLRTQDCCLCRHSEHEPTAKKLRRFAVAVLASVVAALAITLVGLFTAREVAEATPTAPADANTLIIVNHGTQGPIHIEQVTSGSSCP